MSLGMPSGIAPCAPNLIQRCLNALVAVNAAAPSSRAGCDAPALLVARFNLSRNKLLSAASDSSRVWSGLALVWDGDLHPSQVCLE